MTKEGMRAASLANDFAGLPAGTTHLELWDRVNDVRKELNLSSNEIWLLGYYMKKTLAVDWIAGSEPIVAWSKFEVCFDTGWSADTVARTEKLLCEKGIITFRDANNCKRFCYRKSDGSIPKNAKGVSLAPLGTRAEEIYALAHQHAEDKAKLRETFDALFAAKNEVRSLHANPEIPRSIDEMIRQLLGEMPSRKDPIADLLSMTGLLARARHIIAQLSALFGFQNKESTTTQITASPANPAVHTPHTQPVASSATVQDLHRKDAAHKEPKYIKPKKEQILVDLLGAAPETFRDTLEATQERGGGLPWGVVLDDAIDAYGSNLALNKSYLGKLKSQFGVNGTLAALFGLGKMAEKGAEIRNPYGYALALARRTTN